MHVDKTLVQHQMEFILVYFDEVFCILLYLGETVCILLMEYVFYFSLMRQYVFFLWDNMYVVYGIFTFMKTMCIIPMELGVFKQLLIVPCKHWPGFCILSFLLYYYFLISN